MTNTSSNSESESAFTEAGCRIQEKIMELVRNETISLALDTRFSGQDIVKLLLGAQIFAVVDFSLGLGLPPTLALSIMEGSFALKTERTTN